MIGTITSVSLSTDDELEELELDELDEDSLSELSSTLDEELDELSDSFEESDELLSGVLKSHEAHDIIKHKSNIKAMAFFIRIIPLFRNSVTIVTHSA